MLYIVFLLMICDVTLTVLDWERYHPLQDFTQFLSDLESNFTPAVRVSLTSDIHSLTLSV